MTWTIRNKLILFFIIFFILILLSSIYLIFSYQLAAGTFEKIMLENQLLQQLTERLKSVDYYTEKYVRKQHPETLAAYQNSYNQTINLLTELNTNYQQLDENLLLITQSVLYLSQNIIERTKIDNQQAIESYPEFHHQVNLTGKYITQLISINIKTGNDQYVMVRNFLNQMNRKALLSAFLAGLLSLIFLLYFSASITRPLKRIIFAARKISSGNFAIDAINVQSHDELKTIACVFNQMADDLKKLFNQLKEKMTLEKELQKEKMEHLKANNLLREAEIRKFQAQINPHFLYNTLNSISQVAIIEDAEQTGNLIKKIAELLRYNLKESKKMVKIQQELDHIKIYCQIMEIRFGEKLACEINYNPDLTEYLIPGMTIQPLLENAFLHGINELKERQGKIKVTVKKELDRIIIKVSDNGQGMDQATIDDIFQKTEQVASGLKNIVQRLKLQYREDNLITIKSRPNAGTIIKLSLPIMKG